MKRFIIITTLITATIVLPIGWLLGSKYNLIELFKQQQFQSAWVEKPRKELPLVKYAIENLKKYEYLPSSLVLGTIENQTQNFTLAIFSFQTLFKKMSGQAHLPSTQQPDSGYPVIIMIRGFVPSELYRAGVGTKAAAEVFAKNGYFTLAPDFFGFGTSDPESTNSWEARLQKPINIIELVMSVKKNPNVVIDGKAIKLNPNKIGIWAHSNGGQVALTSLEILNQPIPTTLWAPVSAPFPYSMLFYSDENEDEGKEMRKWLSLFEEDYNVFDFSLTQHLNSLTGPIQLHQGTADDAVPIAWNDEFVKKINQENQSRLDQLTQFTHATDSTRLQQPLPVINITYFKYAGADHNLKPVWNEVVTKDLKFFDQYLK